MDVGAGVAPALRRRRLRTPQILGVLALAALLGIGIGIGIHRLVAGQPPRIAAPPTAPGLEGQAVWPAGTRPAPDITTLTDQTGHRFNLASLRGRTVVMEFFDSHCHQECPLAGRTLAAAERVLPAGARPVLVVVSVNPRDTPASARAAAREWGLAGLASWHWLMGSTARLAPVWRAYHIVVRPEKGDIGHTEALYLLDRRGDERAGYLYPYIPGSVAHDLRLLAAPARGKSGAHA